MNEEKRPDGLPEAEFAELLQSVSAMAPLLKGLLGRSAAPPESPEVREPPSACRRREALLLALKPYLSGERCERIDKILGMMKIAEIMGYLK